MAKQQNKAVFLDRDGTVNKNQEKSRKFHVAPLYWFSAKAIRMLNNAGYKIIIVTNQARIAYGLVSEKRVKDTNKKLLKELAQKGARVDALYYCPHHPKDAKVKLKKFEKDCDCRKPKIGMLKKAKKRFGIDFAESFVVGDDSRDIQMGKNAGCKTILVQTGHAGKDGHYKKKPDFTAKNLLEAARTIVKKTKKRDINSDAMARKLNEEERKLLVLGLKTLETGEYFGGGNWIDLKTGLLKKKDNPINPGYFLKQVNGLRVVKEDNHNCGKDHTLYFQNYKEGKNVGIINYSLKNKGNIIIFVNEDTGKLSMMEIV